MTQLRLSALETRHPPHKTPVLQHLLKWNITCGAHSTTYETDSGTDSIIFIVAASTWQGRSKTTTKKHQSNHKESTTFYQSFLNCFNLYYYKQITSSTVLWCLSPGSMSAPWRMRKAKCTPRVEHQTQSTKTTTKLAQARAETPSKLHPACSTSILIVLNHSCVSAFKLPLHLDPKSFNADSHCKAATAKQDEKKNLLYEQ